MSSNLASPLDAKAAHNTANAAVKEPPKRQQPFTAATGAAKTLEQQGYTNIDLGNGNTPVFATAPDGTRVPVKNGVPQPTPAQQTAQQQRQAQLVAQAKANGILNAQFDANGQFVSGVHATDGSMVQNVNGTPQSDGKPNPSRLKQAQEQAARPAPAPASLTPDQQNWKDAFGHPGGTSDHPYNPYGSQPPSIPSAPLPADVALTAMTQERAVAAHPWTPPTVPGAGNPVPITGPTATPTYGNGSATAAADAAYAQQHPTGGYGMIPVAPGQSAQTHVSDGNLYWKGQAIPAGGTLTFLPNGKAVVGPPSAAPATPAPADAGSTINPTALASGVAASLAPSPSPAAAAGLAASLTPTPAPVPATATASTAASPATSDYLSQAAAAVKAYPQLGVAGSPENQRFMQAWNTMGADHSKVLDLAHSMFGPNSQQPGSAAPAASTAGIPPSIARPPEGTQPPQIPAWLAGITDPATLGKGGAPAPSAAPTAATSSAVSPGTAAGLAVRSGVANAGSAIGGGLNSARDAVRNAADSAASNTVDFGAAVLGIPAASDATRQAGVDAVNSYAANNPTMAGAVKPPEPNAAPRASNMAGGYDLSAYNVKPPTIPPAPATSAASTAVAATTPDAGGTSTFTPPTVPPTPQSSGIPSKAANDAVLAGAGVGAPKPLPSVTTTNPTTVPTNNTFRNPAVRDLYSNAGLDTTTTASQALAAAPSAADTLKQASTASQTLATAPGANDALNGATGASQTLASAPTASQALNAAPSSDQALQGSTNASRSLAGPTGAAAALNGATPASTALSGPTSASTALSGPTGAASALSGATDASASLSQPTSAAAALNRPTDASTALNGASTASTALNRSTDASGVLNKPTGAASALGSSNFGVTPGWDSAVPASKPPTIPDASTSTAADSAASMNADGWKPPTTPGSGMNLDKPASLTLNTGVDTPSGPPSIPVPPDDELKKQKGQVAQTAPASQ